MGRFYREYLRKGEGDAAAALRRAQAWVREAMAGDLGLEEHYRRRNEASNRTDADSYKAMRYYRANPGVVPFADPYYYHSATVSDCVVSDVSCRGGWRGLPAACTRPVARGAASGATPARPGYAAGGSR